MTFLIFDMDGVLVDTCRCHARAYQDLWDRCGFTGPVYEDITGRPTLEVVREFTRPLTPSAETLTEWVAFKQQRARHYLQSETVVYDDVAPALAALHRDGIGMGVATGSSRETAESLLERAGIASYFRFVLTAEDVSYGKPHPEIYLRAVDLSGGASGQAMVVEDSASGLEAALAASVPMACIRSGLQVESPLFRGSFAGLADLTKALGVEVA